MTSEARYITRDGVPMLPHSLGRNPKRGDLYSPDIGEHAGHVVEFRGAEGVFVNVVGTKLPQHVVRCLDCLMSWSFGDPYVD